MPTRIRRLTAADAQACRAIRLRSVREHPEAFLASFEEEGARDVAWYKRWLTEKEGRDDDLIFAAFENGEVVGMAGIYRQASHRAKGRHKAMLWGMYVAPEARRRGLGRRLVDEAIRAIASAGDIELVQLGVGTGNHAARTLYARAGFETYGVERRAMKLGDGYVDEELMVRFIA